MALLKNLLVYGVTRLTSDTFANHIYGNGYHHNSHDNNDSVLLAGGGYTAISSFSSSGHSHNWSEIGAGSNNKGNFNITNGSLWIGTLNDTTAERQVGVRSGAGNLYLYSQASATGSRGLYVSAHGTGSDKAIISIDTNNNATFNGSADMLDGVHLNGIFTAFSGGEITSATNTLTQAAHSITIGGVTKTAGASTASIINSLSVSTLSSTKATNLSVKITVNGQTSANKFITNLYSSYLSLKDIRGNDIQPNDTLYPENTITSWYNNTNTPGVGGIYWAGINVKVSGDDNYSWQLCGYVSSANNDESLYFRNGKGTTWGDWHTIIDNVNLDKYMQNYYWANLKLSLTSSTTTTPRFGYVGINVAVNSSYRLYVNGTSSMGTIVPYSNNSYNLGNSNSLRWYSGYFTGSINIGSTSFADASSGYSGSLIGSGYIELCYSTPFIDFHYSNSTADFTSRIIADNYRLSIQHSNDTAPDYTYYERTIKPKLLHKGIFYNNGFVESSRGFLVNRNSDDGGIYIYGNNVEYGRFYIYRIGTASNGTTQGAQGVSLITLGNSTAIEAATSTAGANNAKGILRLYGTNQYYTQIAAQANGNHTFYLPNYGGNMYAIHASNNSQVGSSSTPVYIAANGRVTPCSYDLTTHTHPDNQINYNISANLTSGNIITHPIPVLFNNYLRANRFAGILAAGVTVEYSTNGTSWTTYSLTDLQKRNLFTNRSTAVRIGGPSGNSIDANAKLRITIYTANNKGSIYTVLKKIHIYIATAYSQNCKVTIKAAKQETLTTFDYTICENQPIDGWSGYNEINIPNASGLATYGNTASTQYGAIQFTFSHTGLSRTTNTTTDGLVVNSIFGYGGVQWTTPSTLALSDHLYNIYGDLGCSFPNYLYSPDLRGGKVRLYNNWIGFYSENNPTDSTTRYGYIQTTSDRMYFRKENGVNAYHFDFGGHIYLTGRIVSNSSTTSDGYFLHGTSASATAQYGRFGITQLGTTSAVGYTYLYLGNNTASGTNNNAQGIIVIYGSGTEFTQITNGNWRNSNLSVVNTTNSTANETGTSFISVGNSYDKTSTNPSSTGYIKIYGDSSYSHDIYPGNPTSNKIHYLPDSTGWIATGNTTGVGSSTIPVYLNSSGVLTQCSQMATASHNHFIAGTAVKSALALSYGQNITNTGNIYADSDAIYDIGELSERYNNIYGKFIVVSVDPNNDSNEHGFELCSINSGNFSKLYVETFGTTSTIGVTTLQLGNSISSGTNNNSRGLLRLYGAGQYYVDIKASTTLGNKKLVFNLTAANTSDTYGIWKLGNALLETNHLLNVNTYGEIYRSDANIGTEDSLIYVSSGEISESNASIGNTHKFIYLENGYFKSTTATEGSSTRPIYLDNGVFLQCDFILNTTVNTGTSSRIAYYNSSGEISSSSIISTGSNLGSISYLGINASSTSNFRLLINGANSRIYNGSFNIDCTSATASYGYKLRQTTASSARPVGTNYIYGNLYIGLLGTTSAIGTGILELGNSTASGTAGNSEGHIRLYCSSSYYVDINALSTLTSGGTTYTKNGNFNLYIPPYNGSMWLAHYGGNQVGNSTTPVYISATGRITACNSFPSIPSIPTSLNDLNDVTIYNDLSYNHILYYTGSEWGNIKIDEFIYYNDNSSGTKTQIGTLYVGNNSFTIYAPTANASNVTITNVATTGTRIATINGIDIKNGVAGGSVSVSQIINTGIEIAKIDNTSIYCPIPTYTAASGSSQVIGTLNFGGQSITIYGPPPGTGTGNTQTISYNNLITGTSTIDLGKINNDNNLTIKAPNLTYTATVTQTTEGAEQIGVLHYNGSNITLYARVGSVNSNPTTSGTINSGTSGRLAYYSGETTINATTDKITTTTVSNILDSYINDTNNGVKINIHGYTNNNTRDITSSFGTGNNSHQLTLSIGNYYKTFGYVYTHTINSEQNQDYSKIELCFNGNTKIELNKYSSSIYWSVGDCSTGINVTNDNTSTTFAISSATYTLSASKSGQEYTIKLGRNSIKITETKTQSRYNSNNVYLLGQDGTSEKSLLNTAYFTENLYYNSTGVYFTSDISKKYDIRDIYNYDVERLFETENGFIRHYKWNENDKDSYGFIAQELKEYCPEAVDFNNDTNLYHVNYNVAFSKVIGAMFKKIKELQKEINELKMSNS